MIKGIYIHIPFCHQICNYCDFNKVFFQHQPVDRYIDAILKELEMYVQENEAKLQLQSIFLGGGTPTSLNEHQLERLLKGIEHIIPNARNLEWTSEANPDELTLEKINVLFSNGVNRLSLGVQSFQGNLLEKLGRTHKNEQVFEAIENAKNVGFQNLSIDLMYGLPGQTMDDWKKTLKIAMQLKLQHYSSYSLLVEPKTVFYNLHAKGKLQLPTEELEAEMYAYLMDEMDKIGKFQYEISNFASSGFESIHNQIYWNNEEYAGIGAGAHGYTAGVRTSNIAPILKYIQAVEEGQFPYLSRHAVTEKEAMEEQLFLGLRKTNGVSLRQFEQRFGKSIEEVFGEVLQQQQLKNNLIIEDDYLKIPRHARVIGNEIFSQFLLD